MKDQIAEEIYRIWLDNHSRDSDSAVRSCYNRILDYVLFEGYEPARHELEDYALEMEKAGFLEGMHIGTMILGSFLKVTETTE